MFSHTASRGKRADPHSFAAPATWAHRCWPTPMQPSLTVLAPLVASNYRPTLVYILLLIYPTAALVGTLSGAAPTVPAWLSPSQGTTPLQPAPVTPLQQSSSVSGPVPPPLPTSSPAVDTPLRFPNTGLPAIPALLVKKNCRPRGPLARGPSVGLRPLHGRKAPSSPLRKSPSSPLRTGSWRLQHLCPYESCQPKNWQYPWPPTWPSSLGWPGRCPALPGKGTIACSARP